ncbi:MAG: allantoinase AllB [Candidatus Cloacimonetes bacterium]|nr:allantoinase AllB [Candidatus Cloacimonadota bacterium]
MIIKNGKVALTGNDKFFEVDIKVEEGVIIKIGKNLSEDTKILDVDGLLIFPGGIDPHVHFDDPGYTFNEDFYHGSCSAASGGITTIIDMPCTSIPPVTNIDNLFEKLKVIEQKTVVDFGLYGGVSSQSFEQGYSKNMEELSEYVLGFKTYFISVMKTFGRLNHLQFKEVLEKAKELNLPVLLHAEDYNYVKKATEIIKKEGNSPIHYYNSRPEKAEILAITSAVKLANQVGADLHIVHVGTAKAATLIAMNNVTCETEPHYLEFDLDDFERIGSSLKTTPPVKSPENKEKLWQLLSIGSISFVASDHAPCPEKAKNTGSIWTDYAGIPGCGTLLPYMFSEGYMRGRLNLNKFVQVTSENAAKRYGIFDKKGSIEVGKDADFVLIDAKKNWIVRGQEFYSKGKITPFEGFEFKGKIIKTILRGKVIYDSKKGILAEKGYGKFLRSQ